MLIDMDVQRDEILGQDLRRLTTLAVCRVLLTVVNKIVASQFVFDSKGRQISICFSDVTSCRGSEIGFRELGQDVQQLARAFSGVG